MLNTRTRPALLPRSIAAFFLCVAPAYAPSGAIAQTVSVSATAETTGPLGSADDPAIWVHPEDRSLSLVIGTDKDAGLAVYDLAGNALQFLADGKLNNTDVRYGFSLGGQPLDLVAASNRTSDSINVYGVDPTTGSLASVARGGTIGTNLSVYGLCMYMSPITGKFYAFVSSKDGVVEQWELFDDGVGAVDGVLVRSFDAGTQTEGCVADDEMANLYIGEEDVGIWRYGAEPSDGEERILVDVTGAGGHLTADVEGLTLYYASDGRGYLIASSQGSDEYVLYSREGANEYVGTFAIVAGNGIGGTTYTGGIDVTSVALGSVFPDGLFLAQDDFGSNFKLVPWGAIANAFNAPLIIDTLLDHFKCYKERIQEGKLPGGTAAFLTDEFESREFALKQLGLCNPAHKNGERIVDANTHLTAYAVKPTVGKITPHLNNLVTNQFGEIHVDTGVRGLRLLVPAAKDLQGAVDPPDFRSHDVNHFLCYRVAITPGTPEFQPRDVTIDDQFGQPATFRITAPELLCNPADKNGSGIKPVAPPNDHLLCYGAERGTGSARFAKIRGVHTADQFISSVGVVTQEELLCVPSQTEALAP